ncbi:MAG: hypothetical protein ACFFCE_11165 [Promethearchaeota archaeon]
MEKINLNDNIIEIPSDKSGIDMGQTISKTAYLNNSKLSLSYFLIHTGFPDIKSNNNNKKILIIKKEDLKCLKKY